jgi:hypothetical protein
MGIGELFLQNQTPDYVGHGVAGIEHGVRLSDLLQARQKQREQDEKDRTINGLIQKSIKINPDGSASIDQNSFSALAGVDPQRAMKLQSDIQSFQKGNMDYTDAKSQSQAKYTYTNFNPANFKDAASWDAAVDKAIVDNHPEAAVLKGKYSPQFAEQVFNHAKTALIGGPKGELEQQKGIADIGLTKANTAKSIAEIDKIKNDKTNNSGKVATGLRTERSDLPTTKATQQVSAAYNKIQEAAKNPSAAGDLSLIFSYMKILDPGSTVREGEFANAQNAAGWTDQARNAYNRALNGERLNENQRQDFLKQSENLYRGQKNLQDQIDNQYVALAKKAGVDPKDVIINFEAHAGGVRPKKLVQNGHTYILNEATGEYE